LKDSDVLSILLEYLFARPTLVRLVGSLLWRVGCFGLAAGAIAAALNAILNVVTSMGAAADARYEQLLPGVPTWWIPESPLGITVYMLVMLGAYLLHALARELHRLQRC
jgi:hypothetical protein